jgi:hypothetical protein
MNEVLYPVALAVVIVAIVGFFKTGLRKLKSIQLKVDFSEQKQRQIMEQEPKSSSIQHLKNR